MVKIIKKKKKRSAHRGFVSLEILGVLVIVSLAALFGAEKYSEYLDEQEWRVTATHISTFNEAAKSYIADKTDELLNQSLPFLITPSILIKLGYLQRGFSPENSAGQSYVTGVVRNTRLKTRPTLQALTCSVNGSEISHKGLRAISAQTEGLGGYVNEQNIATGAYGGWTSQPRDFGIDCKNGHLAVALSSEVLGTALQESDRLYRFKVNHRPELNRMHTNIDMGQNSVNNADQVNARSGQFTGSLHSHGRLSVDEFVQLSTGKAEARKSCHPDGLIASDAMGALLSCQRGHWVASGQPEIIHGTNPGCPANKIPVARYWTQHGGSNAGQYCSLQTGWAGVTAPSCESCLNWEQCHMVYSSVWSATACQ